MAHGYTPDRDLHVLTTISETLIAIFNESTDTNIFVPVAAVTQTTDAWNSGGTGIELTADLTDLHGVDIALDENAFLLITTTAASPTVNGAFYVGGLTHRFLFSSEVGFLHVRNQGAGANVTVNITAVGHE